MSNKTWVALHVVGVAVFIGDLVVTGGLEDGCRSGSRTIRRGVREKPVMITDVALTATGAALITKDGSWPGLTVAAHAACFEAWQLADGERAVRSRSPIASGR
jgi:hypothetical protein